MSNTYFTALVHILSSLHWHLKALTHVKESINQSLVYLNDQIIRFKW